MESPHKNIQLILEFLQATFLVLHFSCCILMTLMMILSIILLSMLMICKQLELASELESDLQDNVDWGKKWLVDLNEGKTQLVSFDWSNNNGSIDVKMDGFVLEEKSSFIMLSFPNWIGTLTLSILLKLSPRKMEL